ncbi:MAG: hypothetical protein OEM38_04075 [Gammaproteobacteria bacterium]|nr:hypothetical protein [Gammaproteobacteria bacterium]
MTDGTHEAEENDAVAGRTDFALLYAQIKGRLSAATHGPWTAEKGGAKVYEPTMSKNEPYFTKAEDDCILGPDRAEVMGCSEWMRVSWPDLELMANARHDLEILVAEIERLKSI